MWPGYHTESWNEVCAKKAMDGFFFTSTSRAFVGAPLCRNEEYLLYSIGFAAWLGSAAILVGLYTPWMLKSFFAYLAALPIFCRQQKALRFLRPVVRDGMANITRKRADPSFDFEEPEDLVTLVTQAILYNNETKNTSLDFINISIDSIDTCLLFFVGHRSYTCPVWAKFKSLPLHNKC